MTTINKVSKTKRITFPPEMLKQIEQHGQQASCTTFAEAVRDLIRIGLGNGSRPAQAGRFPQNIREK